MSKKQKRILWPVLTILLVVAVGLVLAITHGGVASTKTEARGPRQSPAFQVQANANKRQPAPATIEVEIISITRNGFEPSEIRRPADPFLLAVNNHGRPTELSLDIYRVNGQKLKEMKGKKGEQRPRQIVDLPPGQYVLKEASHPEWICRILLSAK